MTRLGTINVIHKISEFIILINNTHSRLKTISDTSHSGASEWTDIVTGKRSSRIHGSYAGRVKGSVNGR